MPSPAPAMRNGQNVRLCTFLYTLRMTTISASKARQSLPAQLDRVEAGDEVAITRHGRVVAILINPEQLARHRAAEAWRQADSYGALLSQAREEPLKSAPVSTQRAEELVGEIRTDRSW